MLHFQTDFLPFTVSCDNTGAWKAQIISSSFGVYYLNVDWAAAANLRPQTNRSTFSSAEPRFSLGWDACSSVRWPV